MENSYVIQNMARMLAKTGENIDMMVQNANLTDRQLPEISPMYEDMLLDELNHIQIITLQLTRLLMAGKEVQLEEDGEDGSVFMAGELDYVKGKKSEEEPDE